MDFGYGRWRSSHQLLLERKKNYYIQSDVFSKNIFFSFLSNNYEHQNRYLHGKEKKRKPKNKDQCQQTNTNDKYENEFMYTERERERERA